MADRSVKVTIGANVAPLKAAMADGSRSVTTLGDTATKTGAKLKQGLAMFGVVGGLATLGAAIKSTFTLGLTFTEQMNTLQAVTQATGAEMTDASAKARELGNDISIPATSASDAAQAMTELAKGGLSVSQAMTAAKGTLQLAAAAQVSGAQAAEIQANALNTFGLKAADAGRVADVLANTANAASGEITDFAQAMQQSGSVAKLFGISIEDTSTALGLFANNGVKGSDAGTSLKSMLTQLATPSAKAKKAMAELGLTIYDNQGQFVGLRELTKQLADAQGRMSQEAFQSAAGILFGSDAIRAASILASGGVQAYDDFRASVDRVGGAADLANAKMKGLPGALQQMENAAQDVALAIYDRLAPAVESIVRGFSSFIDVAGPIFTGALGAIFTVLGSLADAFNALPGPIKVLAGALAGLAIAQKIGLISSLSSAFDTVRLRAMYAGDAIRGMSFASLASGARAAGGAMLAAFGGPIGLAIAGVVTGVTLLVSAWKDAEPKVRDFTSAVDANTGALAGNAAQAAAAAMADDLTKWKDLGGDVGVYTAAVLGNTDAQRQMQAEIGNVAARLAEQSGVYASNAATFKRAGISQTEVLSAVSQGIQGNDGAWGKLVTRLNEAKVPFGDVNQANASIRETFAELQPVLDQYQTNVSGLNADLKKAQVEHEAAQGATDAMSGAVDSAADSWDVAGRAMSAAGGVASATASDVDGLSDSVQGQVNALLNLLNVAAQTRSAISSSLTGFVSPVGAYQAVQQRMQATQTSGGGGGGGGGGSKGPSPLVAAATSLVDQAKKDRDAIDKRYADILDVTKARYDEQLSAWEKARDAVKAAADEAQRSAEAFLTNSKDRASAAKDEASALSDLAGFGSQGSTLASALEAQAVAQAKLNVAKDQQAKIEKQLSGTSDPKKRAELQDRLSTLIAQQSSLQAVAAAADKDAADAKTELAANTDLMTDAAQRALDAMQKQATAAAEVISKDQEAADTAETSAARKTKADDTFTANKAKNDAALKALQDKADKDNKAAADKYETLLAAKNAAEEKSKASSVSHGGGVSGAAKKMAEDAAPSFQAYMDELQRQVDAQERWADNIVNLAGRVGPGVAKQLALMGPQAAPMIQMLVDQTDTQLQQWVPLFDKSTKAGTDAVLARINAAVDPAGDAGLAIGDETMAGLTDAIKSAKSDAEAKAAMAHVHSVMQQALYENQLKVYLNADLAGLNQQMANAFGAGYNPASFWGQGAHMAKGGWIPGAASGEWITGGIPGQDSVLRWLMPGEAVIPTANAQANRPVVDALIAGRPIVMPQGDNGALVAEVRALRAETARLTSVVASSSAQNAATVVGGLQDQADRDLLKSRKRSL